MTDGATQGMPKGTPKAYHGPAWHVRPGTLQEDIRAGLLWSPYQVDSEWKRLTDIVLHEVGMSIALVKNPDAVLHLDHMDFGRLVWERMQIFHTFAGLGVRVHKATSGGEDVAWPNLIYQRDVFWQTPHGAVIPRLASPVRAGEERLATTRLVSMGVPIALTIGGRGIFEGADALWLDEKTVLFGIGHRSNANAGKQIQRWLSNYGIRVLPVLVPPHVQHLLGVVQIIAPDKVMVRTDLVDIQLLSTLQRLDVEIISVRESIEISEMQAFNFVVVGESSVVIPEDTPRFADKLMRWNIDIAGTVPIYEYRKGAGGLACATGILAREVG